MTVYTIFGQGAESPSFGASPGSTYATVFTLSQSASLTGIWYFSGASDGSLPTQCVIWDVATKTEVSGTLVTSPSWSGALGSGWVKQSYGGAVTLDTRANGYVVSVLYPNAQKGFVSGVTFPITSGILTAPNADEYGSTNCTFINAGGTLTYPSSSGGGINWFVDVEVTTSAAVSGTVQPLPTFATPPRRRPARVVTGFVPVTTFNTGHGPAGTVQPLATFPTIRRRPARGVTGFIPVRTFNTGHGPAGTVQPEAVPAVMPRRKPSRGTTGFIPVATANNVHPVAPTPQPPPLGGGKSMLSRYMRWADL